MLRPQTWYLLLAVVCCAVCCIAGAGTTLQLVVLIAAAVLSAAIVPLHRNRRLQAALCLLPMLAMLAWYVLLAVNNGAETLSWQYVLPAIGILAVFMARKGIVHDEKVVRAYDRIR